MKFKMTLESGREIDLEFEQTDEYYYAGENEFNYTTTSYDGSHDGKKIHHSYREDAYYGTFKEINTGVEFSTGTDVCIYITDKDYLTKSGLEVTDGYATCNQDIINRDNMNIPISWNLSEDEEEDFLEKLDDVMSYIIDLNENILIEKIENDEIDYVYEAIGKQKVEQKQEQKIKRENKLSI